jgi:hypothetical protein
MCAISQKVSASYPTQAKLITLSSTLDNRQLDIGSGILCNEFHRVIDAHYS